MARIDKVQRENLTARQQRVYDEIMSTRPNRTLSGPFSVWMSTPDIAEHADRLANCFRFGSKLPYRLIELIVLVMCREKTINYVWSVHEPIALENGLKQEIIDAIRTRTQPAFEKEDEHLIYDFAMELSSTRTVSAGTFERTKSAFGLECVVEAATCVGFYDMIGYVVNVFDIPPPDPRYSLT
jgi:4-carboxymuconolactone decarboxylase